MTLVRFRKPRARFVHQYSSMAGWISFWRVYVNWEWHNKAYSSQGEHTDLECALRHAFRPVIEEGWLRHVPADWVPDSLKPLQVMARLNHYGEAP